MWMLDGIAGGLQPWWHHVGAYHEDRRMYQTAEPVYRWHRNHEEFLVNREPVATVGAVWSQQNYDFYGRDDADWLVELPWRGITQALIRARIPYLPVHADHIDRDANQFSVLVLPNLGALSEAQVDSIRRFVQRGGGLLATGESSLFNNTSAGGGRIAYLPADLDRRFGRDNLPDHGDILRNLLRWTAKDNIPLAVEGPGLIDCHLYRQPGRLILHRVNLTSAGTWRQPVRELIPVGPLHVRLKLPADMRGKRARLLVSGKGASVNARAGWCHFETKTILDHEVIVLG